MTTPPTSPPPGSPDYKIPLPEMSQHYKPQFKIDVAHWKKFWGGLFHGPTQLTNLQVHQMTDQFVNFVWSSMNKVLDDALENQKKLEEERKKEANG